ncbi:MAG: sigma-54-dependent Fis family transcriptional regulator [Planctomycetes bacterium]|nr:sigma-54-dependent Fis family transcriptional regulator [Planctomycetota bacterium]MBI3835310.1 sigma-54-dependent Fis family transcriptional regulator [Planctomycetota bacterium]
MANVAVIDDKEILRESLHAALTREDHSVSAFEDGAEALRTARDGRFDVVLADLKMPRMDGLSFIRELRAAGCETPVVVMTAYATVATAVEAMKLGAFDYIQKPFDADAVAVVIERAIEHARLRQENEALRTSVEDLRAGRQLVGSSRAMSSLREELDRVASSPATALIAGESGTGKELVASYIHAASQRSGRLMLCLNCAALSANLLESELFGHERGSFTGADRTRKGRFELAHGGTLLLDEISEMALGLQAKLLRVLQEGEFERVGSSTTRRADVRVIATTNRDLEDWVAKKRFRQDLFYRINVLPVRVPPLRERTEDLPELSDHFLTQATAAEGRPTPKVSPSAIRAMTAYSWPGNVRELENLCRRAATLCRSDTIEASLIEPWLKPGASVTESVAPLRPGRMLEDLERQLIERTLTKFNGHRMKTARELGMGVRTLGMKLKQWREEASMSRASMHEAALVEA